jgi:hypothetical protein
MPRKERIHIPGAVYHVILRGNDHREIFADDKNQFRPLFNSGPCHSALSLQQRSTRPFHLDVIQPGRRRSKITMMFSKSILYINDYSSNDYSS